MVPVQVDGQLGGPLPASLDLDQTGAAGPGTVLGVLGQDDTPRLRVQRDRRARDEEVRSEVFAQQPRVHLLRSELQQARFITDIEERAVTEHKHTPRAADRGAHHRTQARQSVDSPSGLSGATSDAWNASSSEELLVQGMRNRGEREARPGLSAPAATTTGMD